MTLPASHIEPVDPNHFMTFQGLNLKTFGSAYSRSTQSANFPLNKPFKLPAWILSGGTAVQKPMTGLHTARIGKFLNEAGDADMISLAPINATGQKELLFDVPALSVPGWYRADFTDSAGRRSSTHAFHVGGKDDDLFIPRWLHTFDIFNRYQNRQIWTMVSIHSRRRPRLLRRRAVQPFTKPVKAGNLFFRFIAADNGDHGVFRRADGSFTAANQMSYEFQDLFSKYPVGACNDGARNVNSRGMITWLDFGTATQFADPNSAPMGNIYGGTGHSMFRLTPDGNMTTIFGRYLEAGEHPMYPGDGQVPTATKFIGNVEDLPADERVCSRMWKGFWYPQTVRPNPAGAQTEGNGRQAHAPFAPFGGPMWCAIVGWTKDRSPGIPETRAGMLMGIIWRPDQHDQPPRAVPLIRGLYDPMQAVIDVKRNRIYISERGFNRVSIWDATTFAPLGTLVEGIPGQYRLDEQNHDTVSIASLEARRAANVCGAEGLAFADDDHLLISGKQMACVKMINLDSLVIRHCVNVTSPRNFLLVEASDGTFGAKWSFAISAFKTAMQGMPTMFFYDPVGDKWIGEYLAEYDGKSRITHGRGPFIIHRDYDAGIAIRDGRLICAAARRGIVEASLALPTDLPRLVGDAAEVVRRGQQKSMDTLHFNEAGEPIDGHPIPWGMDPDIDAMLLANEHVPLVVEPPIEPPAPPPPPPPPAPAPALIALEIPLAGLEDGAAYRLEKI